MENEKTTKKWIKVTQKVTFYQEVELNNEDLQILENLDDLDISPIADDAGEAFYLIERLIDFSDVFDTEQEFTDFELTDN